MTQATTSTAPTMTGTAGTFLIGYDVESADPGVTRPFLRRLQEIHEATGVPATLFLCGRTVERNIDALRPLARHPLFDFQQHTYNHVLLELGICIEDPNLGLRFFQRRASTRSATKYTAPAPCCKMRSTSNALA